MPTIPVYTLLIAPLPNPSFPSHHSHSRSSPGTTSTNHGRKRTTLHPFLQSLKLSTKIYKQPHRSFGSIPSTSESTLQFQGIGNGNGKMKVLGIMDICNPELIGQIVEDAMGLRSSSSSNDGGEFRAEVEAGTWIEKITFRNANVLANNNPTNNKKHQQRTLEEEDEEVTVMFKLIKMEGKERWGKEKLWKKVWNNRSVEEFMQEVEIEMAELEDDFLGRMMIQGGISNNNHNNKNSNKAVAAFPQSGSIAPTSITTTSSSSPSPSSCSIISLPTNDHHSDSEDEDVDLDFELDLHLDPPPFSPSNQINQEQRYYPHGNANNRDIFAPAPRANSTRDLPFDSGFSYFGTGFYPRSSSSHSHPFRNTQNQLGGARVPSQKRKGNKNVFALDCIPEDNELTPRASEIESFSSGTSPASMDATISTPPEETDEIIDPFMETSDPVNIKSHCPSSSNGFTTTDLLSLMDQDEFLSESVEFSELLDSFPLMTFGMASSLCPSPSPFSSPSCSSPSLSPPPPTTTTPTTTKRSSLSSSSKPRKRKYGKLRVGDLRNLPTSLDVIREEPEFETEDEEDSSDGYWTTADEEDYSDYSMTSVEDNDEEEEKVKEKEVDIPHHRKVLPESSNAVPRLQPAPKTRSFTDKKPSSPSFAATQQQGITISTVRASGKHTPPPTPPPSVPLPPLPTEVKADSESFPPVLPPDFPLYLPLSLYINPKSPTSPSESGTTSPSTLRSSSSGSSLNSQDDSAASPSSSGSSSPSSGSESEFESEFPFPGPSKSFIFDSSPWGADMDIEMLCEKLGMSSLHDEGGEVTKSERLTGLMDVDALAH